MTKYRVWSKYDEEKDDAIEIDTWDEESAAIEWGEIKDGLDFFDYNYEGTVVCVLDENDKCEEYTVYAETELRFCAYEGEES